MEIWEHQAQAICFVAKSLKKIAKPEYETCPTCKGSCLKRDPDDNYDIDDPCDDCCGTGKVEKE